MRCERCQGEGKIAGTFRVAMREQGVPALEYPISVTCGECGGTGIVSCCEGSPRHGQLPDKEE